MEPNEVKHLVERVMARAERIASLYQLQSALSMISNPGNHRIEYGGYLETAEVLLLLEDVNSEIDSLEQAQQRDLGSLGPQP